MSYHITIVAKTPEELEAKYLAFKNKFISSGTVSTEVEEDLDDDEVIDVPSSFAGQRPSLNMVVDNEVDKEGIPWDARIHASTKTKTTKGVWKSRKGVDDTLFDQVKAELRARVSGAQVQQQVVTPPVHIPQVLAPMPTPQQNQNGHTFETFKNNFPMIVSNLISQGKLTQEYVSGLCAHYGVAQIWQAQDAHLLEMFSGFAEYGFIQKIG